MKLLSCLVFVSTLLCAGCSEPSPSQAGSPTQASSGSPQSVNVVAVESQKLNTVLSLPAQIIPYETVDIYPKVTGFIETIRVDRGSHVRAGEVIVRLSAPELLAQRAQAEASLQAAHSQLSAAQAKLASDEGTYKHLDAAAKTPGVVAGNDLQVAEQSAAADRAQVDAATNNVRAAQDALRSVQQLEAYLEIRAPFDGVVTLRNLHPGALVGPASGTPGAQPIVQVEDLDRLRLVVPVPEAYVAGIREGQQATFSVPAYPGRTFHAPIARIAHDVTQNTRTMAVELDVRNPDAQITPGSFATVEWPIQRSYPTMLVPSTAVTTDLQRTFVIRVREGKAEWVDVKTGVAVSGKTEVFGELQPGDIVVANATDAIRPGTGLSTHQLSSAPGS
ncbi:MAG TPA: efflux RND transporter periplasmic adaptor subunit [Candidatus Sulfotelmatobacter sp.]|nr:efflux RND transporter periplasmic adaptor subunit [Candidatus Sulfotelmatobacter sp.]